MAAPSRAASELGLGGGDMNPSSAVRRGHYRF